MISFAILGAQKAATSSLQANLQRVPGIYMPEGESTFFEDLDYASQLWRDFRDPSGRDAICGIKRPDLLCRPDLIARVNSAIPNAKFIVVLREPISRAVSAYYHLVRHAHLPFAPLNRGMRDAVTAYVDSRNTIASSIVSYGLYGEHLEEWFNLYPRNQFLILSQQRVRQDLEGSLRRCLDHLGCNEPIEDAFLQPRESNVGLYDVLALRLANYGAMLKTKRLHPGWRRVPRGSWPLRLAGHAAYLTANRLAGLRGADRETLDPEITEELKAIFSTDEHLLRKLIGNEAIDWTYAT